MSISSYRSTTQYLLFIVFVICLSLQGSIFTWNNFRDSEATYYKNLADDYRRHAQTSQGSASSPEFAVEQVAINNLNLSINLRWAMIADDRADRCARSYLR